jgi:DNA-binding transcriptional regulator YiaG
MTQANKPLDFAKVEDLRRHMLMTTIDMARALHTSRMTYYKWVQGKAVPRSASEAVVRRQLKKLLDIMAIHKWPSSEIIGMAPKDRTTRLLALLSEGE